MSALLIALLVVAYLTIGAVLAGILGRMNPYDDEPELVTVLWPAFVLTMVGYLVIVVISAPFRAIYRAVRGKS